MFAFGKRVFKKIGEDDVGGAAAELAYRFFLALFPFFIFLAALGGFIASALNVANPTQQVMDFIGDSLPDDSAGILERELAGILQQRNLGLLSIGIVGSIVAASGGINSLMKHMNRIYTVSESRHWLARNAISIALTVLSAVVLVTAFVLFFVGQLYGPRLAEEVGLGSLAGRLLTFARWPLAVVLMTLGVAVLYSLAPNRRVPMGWISPGALVFSLGWAVVTFLFGVYAGNFASYNAVYGTLGGVVIMLVWFYLTAFLLLLGAEINAVLAEKDEEASAGDQRQEPARERTPVGV